jgi:hypothetical protein
MVVLAGRPPMRIGITSNGRIRLLTKDTKLNLPQGKWSFCLRIRKVDSLVARYLSLRHRSIPPTPRNPFVRRLVSNGGTPRSASFRLPNDGQLSDFNVRGFENDPPARR